MLVDLEVFDLPVVPIVGTYLLAHVFGGEMLILGMCMLSLFQLLGMLLREALTRLARRQTVHSARLVRILALNYFVQEAQLNINFDVLRVERLWNIRTTIIVGRVGPFCGSSIRQRMSSNLVAVEDGILIVAGRTDEHIFIRKRLIDDAQWFLTAPPATLLVTVVESLLQVLLFLQFPELLLETLEQQSLLLQILLTHLVESEHALVLRKDLLDFLLLGI